MGTADYSVLEPDWLSVMIWIGIIIDAAGISFGSWYALTSGTHDFFHLLDIVVFTIILSSASKIESYHVKSFAINISSDIDEVEVNPFV